MSKEQTTISYGRIAATVVGTAFLLMCLKRVTLALDSYMQDGVYSLSLAIGLYALYAVILVLAALGVGYVVADARRVCAERVVAIVCAACGIAGISSLYADSFMVFVTAIVLTAIFVGSFIALWGIRLASLPLKIIPVVVLGSSLLDSLLGFCVSFTGFSAIRSLYPLAALVPLFVCPMKNRTRPASERASLLSMPWGMVGTCGGLLAVWSLALGMMPQGSGGVLNRGDQTWSYGVTSIMLLLLTLAAFWMYRTDKVSRQTFLYPFVAIVLTYLVIVMGMLAMQTGDNFMMFKRAFISVSRCLETFAIMLIVYGAAERALSPVMALALFIALLSCGTWMVVATALQTSGLFEGSLVGEWAALGLSLVTSVVLILYLLRSATVATAKGEVDAEAAQRARCEKASAAHGLSKKEQEVAQLLYRGLSAKRIAEELYISENTVRSHTSNIYHKLGVHSKQELMQLFDGYDD